jgi:hypothetical protein
MAVLRPYRATLRAVIARFRRATQYPPVMRMNRSLIGPSRSTRPYGDYWVPRLRGA